MKHFEGRKSQKKYCLVTRIYRGSVGLRNGRKGQYGKKGHVEPIIYVQTANFKILDLLTFRLKPLEGRKSRKNYWLGTRIYRGSVDLRKDRKGQYGKKGPV